MTDRSGSSVTLMDVAREAGVSLATASRAINGSDRRVRENLRMRVLEAASRLQYTANVQAQAMVRGRTDVIGLIVHDISDAFFSSIAAGVMQAADTRNLLVTLASTQRSPDREVEHVASLRGQRARAVILAGSRFDDESSLQRLGAEIASFEAIGGRVAMVSQRLLPVDTVLLENRAGAKALAQRLVELGYRRFGVLTAPWILITATERVEGFIEGLRQADVAPPVAAIAEFTRDGGYDAMVQLLEGGHELDCVFAVNDVMAVGAMAALRDHGVRLPGDIAVAGFDDIVTSRDVTPALTTVRVPLLETGIAALDMVLQPRAESPRLRRIRGEVIVRASTPPVG
jgi:LacI family transcriptional regulator